MDTERQYGWVLHVDPLASGSRPACAAAKIPSGVPKSCASCETEAHAGWALQVDAGAMPESTVPNLVAGVFVCQCFIMMMADLWQEPGWEPPSHSPVSKSEGLTCALAASRAAAAASVAAEGALSSVSTIRRELNGTYAPCTSGLPAFSSGKSKSIHIWKGCVALDRHLVWEELQAFFTYGPDCQLTQLMCVTMHDYESRMRLCPCEHFIRSDKRHEPLSTSSQRSSHAPNNTTSDQARLAREPAGQPHVAFPLTSRPWGPLLLPQPAICKAHKGLKQMQACLPAEAGPGEATELRRGACLPGS